MDNNTIRELINFYGQKYHVPIFVAPNEWRFKMWDKHSILIGWSEEPFWDDLNGMEATEHTIIGDNFLIILCEPTKEIIEAFLPKLAIKYLKLHRKQFLNNMTVFTDDLKRQKEQSLTTKKYKIDNLANEIKELSREIAVDRKLLEFCNRSKPQLLDQAIKMYRDVKKLVPGLYASIRFDNGVLLCNTNPITIKYDDGYYEFQPFEVEIDLFSSDVKITGNDNEVNGYIHPHIGESGSVCWGNIGHLVNQLIGEIDLPGLLQLVHKFISTYNPDDPYQRIEYWDPYWEPEEVPYCEVCDEDGHYTSDCEWAYWCNSCGEFHSVQYHCPKEAEDEAA